MEDWRQQFISSINICAGGSDEVVQFIRSLQTLSSGNASEDDEEQYHIIKSY